MARPYVDARPEVVNIRTMSLDAATPLAKGSRLSQQPTGRPTPLTTMGT